MQYANSNQTHLYVIIILLASILSCLFDLIIICLLTSIWYYTLIYFCTHTNIQLDCGIPSASDGQFWGINSCYEGLTLTRSNAEWSVRGE